LMRQIFNHDRRLQKLKEQHASLGLHTPPHILTEIEDIEVAIKELQIELKAVENSSFDKESPRDLTKLAEDTQPKQRVQIYLSGDFTLLTTERRSATIDAFAAVMGISSQAIEIYSVYQGSIIFDLGIPSPAVHAFVLSCNLIACSFAC